MGISILRIFHHVTSIIRSNKIKMGWIDHRFIEREGVVAYEHIFHPSMLETCSHMVEVDSFQLWPNRLIWGSLELISLLNHLKTIHLDLHVIHSILLDVWEICQYAIILFDQLIGRLYFVNPLAQGAQILSQQLILWTSYWAHCHKGKHETQWRYICLMWSWLHLTSSSMWHWIWYPCRLWWSPWFVKMHQVSYNTLSSCHPIIDGRIY